MTDHKDKSTMLKHLKIADRTFNIINSVHLTDMVKLELKLGSPWKFGLVGA